MPTEIGGTLCETWGNIRGRGGSCLNIKPFDWILFDSSTVSVKKYLFVRKKQIPKNSLEIHYNRLNQWSNIFVSVVLLKLHHS